MQIENILAANNLVDLVEASGTQLKHTSGNYRGACPIHQGRNPTAFAVYEESGKQKWKCYSDDCGGGDVIDFVIALHRTDFKGALQILGGSDHSLSPEALHEIATERRKRAAEQAEQKRKEYQAALDELREARRWEAYYLELMQSIEAQNLWIARGVDIDHQHKWRLGYCPKFGYATSQGYATSPSLTIPIFDLDEEILTIRHRILNPVTKNDKYRPDRKGLKSVPFLANPKMGYDADKVFVLEGEIKAMVFYQAYQDNRVQVVGVAGKETALQIAESMKGQDNITVMFDPDATREAAEFARIVGGVYVPTTYKIDDAILAGVSPRELRVMMELARKS